MSEQIVTEPVMDFLDSAEERARRIAEHVEEVATQVGRTISAIEVIIDGVKFVYRKVVSFFDWLKSLFAGGTGNKVQLVVTA